MKKTFAFIKPCAHSRGDSEKMKKDIKAAGFDIESEVETEFTTEEAEWLYREHSEKGHFKDLVEFTTSGKVMMLVLSSQSENTPEKFRELMGPSVIENAEPHTLRGKYAETMRRNGIHGSDGNESAEAELAYFEHRFV